MIRKKQILMQAQEAASSISNAKVTVQYIQPQRQADVHNNLASSNHLTNKLHHHHHANEELEVENVEYLEEHASGGEDFVEDQNTTNSIVKNEEYEDTFYPNAIDCLLDLYKSKYESVIMKTSQNEMKNFSHIWLDIAQEMHKSYFEFEAEQIRQKFYALRQQYFNVQSCNDIDNFDYFEQMHDIYKDPLKEMISKGGHLKELVSRTVYKDEDLVKTAVNFLALPKIHRIDGFKSEEIVHKEHEFMDMVEKELQAMENDEQIQQQNHKVVTNSHEVVRDKAVDAAVSTIKESDVTMPIKTVLKRHLASESEGCEKPVKLERKSTLCLDKESLPNSKTKCPDTNHIDKSSNKYPEEFSLYDYNEHQERRHREQLQLLEQQQRQQRDQLDVLTKSLKLHETLLQQQNLLFQELIKRLPPT